MCSQEILTVLPGCNIDDLPELVNRPLLLSACVQEKGDNLVQPEVEVHFDGRLMVLDSVEEGVVKHLRLAAVIGALITAVTDKKRAQLRHDCAGNVYSSQ